MPPPIYSLGIIIKTKVIVSARVCKLKNEKFSPWSDFNIGKGYWKILLPIGHYEIRETSRDVRYYHDPEHSDGYTYRLRAIEKENPLYDKRISIWQNGLFNAIEGTEEEDM
jgi:hypothetical protein